MSLLLLFQNNLDGNIIPINPTFGGAGGGGNFKSTKRSDREEYNEKRKKKLKKDSEEWMLLIKIFSEQCQ